MQIINEPQLDFADVLLKPKRSTLSSRKGVHLLRTYKGKWNQDLSFTNIPIVCANMDNIATWNMMSILDKNNMMIAMSKFTPDEEWQNKLKSIGNNFFFTIGIRDKNIYKNYKKLKTKYSDKLNKLVIDVPNGYSEQFLNFISKVRKENPETFIVAGNVVSAEQTEEIIVRGADCVKIGIGSGTTCITREKSGVGRPQLSTTIECANAAHGLGGYVMSDGGCTTPGDIAKAFAAGADFVMLGGMFAGHDECENDVITRYILSHHKKSENENPDDHTLSSNKNKYAPVYVEKKFKKFWGMSSTTAMKKHYGKHAKYRSSEGREVLVPSRGPVQNTIDDILGGLRSACTYIGARLIKDIPKCATFYIVYRQVNNPYDK